MNSSRLLLLLLPLSLALLVGCNAQEKSARSMPDDAFAPDDASRSVWQVLESQTAAGAAEDGMLYDAHFDGSDLNDAGRDKLDLMARASRRPLVVYLNLTDGADADADARHASVERWLRGAGLDEQAASVEVGANPSSPSPAAYGISRLPKTESGAAGGGASGTANGTSNSTR